MRLPGAVRATVTVAASAVRHAGWWLDWHTRHRPGQGCRDLTAA